MDPLIKGNIMLYLRELAIKKEHEFYVVSYEQANYKLQSKDFKILKQELSELGIFWYPLKFSKGNTFIKAYDFLKSIALVFHLRIFKQCSSIISLGSIAGVMAYLFAKFFRLNLFLYQYEPHSEFALDGKIWSKNSFRYKTVNKLEYLAALHAKVISTGTHHMMDRLVKWNCEAKVYKIPSVVDEKAFVFNPEERMKIRNKFNLSENSHLIIYPGKFGDLYYSNEIGILFKHINERIENCFFLILTLTDTSLAQGIFDNNKISKSQYSITTVQYKEMPNYISAADLGIIAIPPWPSNKFRSPIKTGEFLCMGLPYLICKGISEDDEFAVENKVGIVLNDFSESSVQDQIENIKIYLEKNVPKRREKLRELGIDYRGFSNLHLQFDQAVEALIST